MIPGPPHPRAAGAGSVGRSTALIGPGAPLGLRLLSGPPPRGPHSSNIFSRGSGPGGLQLCPLTAAQRPGWLPGASLSPRPFSAWGAQSSPFARPGCCQRGTVATPRLCTTPSTGHAPQPGGLYQILVKNNKPPGWWSSRKVWNPLGFCKSGRGADGRVPVFTIFALQFVTSACCSTSTDSLPRADGPCQWQGFPVSACCIRLCPSISRYGQSSVMQSTSIMSWARGIFPSSGHGSPMGFLHFQFIVFASYDDLRPVLPGGPGRAVCPPRCRAGPRGSRAARPLVLTLDTLGAVWPLAQAGRAPAPQERGGGEAKKGGAAAQPPPREEEARRPTATSGAARQGPREGAPARREQGRSRPAAEAQRPRQGAASDKSRGARPAEEGTEAPAGRKPPGAGAAHAAAGAAGGARGPRRRAQAGRRQAAATPAATQRERRGPEAAAAAPAGGEGPTGGPGASPRTRRAAGPGARSGPPRRRGPKAEHTIDVSPPAPAGRRNSPGGCPP